MEPFFLPGREITLHNGKVLKMECKNSARAKRMRLTLNADGKVLLTLPVYYSRKEAEEFLVTSLPWLERMSVKLEEKRSAGHPPGEYLKKRKNGFYPLQFCFPAFREIWEIRYEFRDVCWCGAREEKEKNILAVTGCVTEPLLVRDTLCDYLKRKGLLLFKPVLDSLSETCFIPYEKLSMRIQKGRWGSCSSKGNISLNGMMLFFPEEALRYVMIHELCHLRHMDHSAGFWREVSRFCPDFRIVRQQIRKGFPEMWMPPPDL